MRSPVWLVVALLLALLPAGCSTPPPVELQNDSGQVVRIETGRGSVWQGRHTVAAGERSSRFGMPSPDSWRLRIGRCSYIYPTLDWARAPRNVAWWAPGAKNLGKAYALVTIDPALVLHVRLLSLDGAAGEEVLADGLPARPVADCPDP